MDSVVLLLLRVELRHRVSTSNASVFSLSTGHKFREFIYPHILEITENGI